MLTIKFKIKLNSDDAKFIQELQRQQSALIRSAYVAADKFDTEIELREFLTNRFSKKPNYEMMDSWFIQSALYSGRGSAKADLKLDVTNRNFGGKANAISRAENKISKNEFKKERLNPLYIIGEAPASGNRKFKFNSIDSVTFKPFRGKSIEIKLHSLRKNYKKLLTAAFDAANSKKLPITVTMTSEFICFSFEEAGLNTTKKYKKEIKTRYAGIDLNPNYVGVSVHDGDKLISTRIYSLKELTTKKGSDSKLEFETFEIGNDIVSMLKHFQVSKVFVEDLTKIRKSKAKPKGKSFNSLVINKWKREKLLRPINRVFGKNCIQINAAYTSTIGNILNPNLPDPIAASVAIAKRGFEIVIAKSKKFYPELPEKKVIEDRWKKTNVLDFRDWIELHTWLKTTGLKYRVDVPDTSMFRILSSKKSRVYKLDNFSYN